MTPPPSRRTFVGLAASGFLGASLVSSRLLGSQFATGDELRRFIATLWRSDPRAVHLGQVYLDSLNPLPRWQDLAAAVQGRIPPAQRSRACRSPTEVRRALDRVVREDFGRSRTVLVDGWLLSETETQLCALARLSSAWSPRAV